MDLDIIEMKKEFGERLKNLRESRHLSQLQLATKINISKSLVGEWELGHKETKLTGLVSLSQFFNVTINYLAGLE